MPAPNHAEEVERLERLANRLDAAFRIPGTGIRLGWDSILGVLPGVGDLVTIAPGVYIMHRASALGVPGHKLARMGLNVGIDWVVGSIPLLGDIFDVGFKSNRRNVRLIREHFGLPERHPLTSGNH
ncbi:membrane protein [Oceanicola sp. 22II-s10i]|nr:membrane protein [Oceanicola sp. 22II-s10i]